MTKSKTAAPTKAAAKKTTTPAPAVVPAKKAASKAVSVKKTAAPKTAAKKVATVKKAAPVKKAATAKKAAPVKKAAVVKKAASPKTKAAAKAPAKKTAVLLTTAARKAESVKKPAAPAKVVVKQAWSNSPPGTLAALKAVATALIDKKASDLRILHLGHRSSITDFIVIATGLAETHLRALHIESEKVFDLIKYPIIGIDRQTDSGWVVVDAADIMVHIFTEEKRGFYALESNWKDAEIVTLAQLG